MRKLIWLISFLHLSSSALAQCNVPDCLSKGAMAVFVYDNLYGNNNPNIYPSFNYPDPFIDLYDEPIFDNKIKVLSYLDYNDGITVFQSQGAGEFFIGSSGVTRYDAVAFLLEAWNIKPDYTGSVFYQDIDSSNPYYGYINEAEDLDLLEGIFGNNFNGEYGISTLEFVQILNNILSDRNLHPISQNELRAEKNYFLPNNFQPETLGFLRGMEQGVFSHYAKNSFVIPDRKMNLNFSHYYSTQLVELPQSYFPIQPLGRGWTHTYNTYIIRENNVGPDEIDYYYIKWSDGSIHIFNEDEDEYISEGVYDELEESNGEFEIIITKKTQVKYFFDRFHIPGTDKPIYYLEKIVDRNGNETLLSYEESDIDNDFARLEKVTAPSGKTLIFSYYDNTDYIKGISDPIGREITFRYSDDRLKYFNDAKEQETKYYYLSNDEDVSEEHQYKRFLLRRVRLPEGNSIRAEYDDDDNGKLRRYSFNDLDYEVDLKIDYTDEDTPIKSTVTVPLPNGSTEQKYQYNSNGLIVDYEDDSNKFKIEYPSSGNKVLLPSNTDVNGLDIEYDYDDNGNIERIDIENGRSVKRFVYNTDNTIRRYQDPNGNSTSFYYDNNGNLLTIADALGTQIINRYDSFGQLTSTENQEGISLNYSYEDDGGISTITAPENLNSSFTYDGINRMETQTINGQTSSYSYDNNDNITSQTNIGGYTTSFDYDENDNMVSIINTKGIETKFEYNNDDQVTSETFGSLEKKFTYNDDGSLKSYTKPAGNRIDYEYDSEGRLEETGTITDHDYNDENLLESIANDDSRLNFEYNRLNRITSVQDEYTDTAVGYEYDNAGNVTQMTYPDGFKVFYDYDAKNRLTSVTAQSASGDTDYNIATYIYYKDDRLRRVIYGNQTQISHFYDDAGRLIKKIFTDNTTDEDFFEQNLTIDVRGNITSERLKYRLDGEQPTPTNTEFESSGNSYDENNHLTGNYEVNPNGNLNSNGTNSFSYDSDDRLVQQQKDGVNIVYKYNPYGQLISRIENGVEEKHVWDILAENIIVTGENFNIQRHIYGLGLEATVDFSGNVQYYHGDHRGNVLMVSDADREIQYQYSYDDFGKTTVLKSPIISDNNAFTFMGKYGILNEDSEQGLYYVRARYYDSKTGRFLTQDPVWSANLYPYASNNPISKIDKNGKNDSWISIDPIKAYNELVQLQFENGYGDGANQLSKENKLFNAALNNPYIAGPLIGFGTTSAGAAFYEGALIISSIEAGVSNTILFNFSSQGATYTLSGYGSLNSTKKLILELDNYQKGANNKDLIYQLFLDLVGPELLKLSAPQTQLYELLNLFRGN